MTNSKIGRPAQASYVVRRGTIYHYHRVVPDDVHQKIGKRIWKQSLRTGYKPEAIQKARALAVEHDTLIARLRTPDPFESLPPEDRARIEDAGGVDSYLAWLNSRARDADNLRSQAESLKDAVAGEPIDLGGWIVASAHTPSDPAPDPEATGATVSGMVAEARAIDMHVTREATTVRKLKIPDLTRSHPKLATTVEKAPEPTDDNITLSALIDAWERQKKPRTSSQYRYPLGLFIEEFGDLPVQSITKANVRSFRDMLPKLAQGRHNRETEGRKLATLRKRAKSGASLIGPTTVAKYLRALGTVMRFAVDEGYIDIDPVANIKPPATHDKATPERERKRRSLTPAEVRKLLDASSRLISTAKPTKIDLGWFVRVQTYTGARGEEIAQLTAKDIVTTGAHPFIRIHGEGDNLIKNVPSWRVVPIHPALTAFGFLDFVKARSNGETIWTTLPLTKQNRRYQRMSRRLTSLLRSEGIKDDTPEGRKVVGHSLRHTFKDSARTAEVPEELAERMQGHKSPDRATARGYGDASQLPLLAKWMAKIDPLDARRRATDFDDGDED